MDWHDAIHAFWGKNSSKTWLSVQPTGNCSFAANVDFTADEKSTSVLTRVTLIRNGREDGAVVLEEAGELTFDEYQTKFLPIKPSVYSYVERTNSIHISGRSPKMGNYRVAITPTNDEV